jgi:hypothetical protein
LGDGAGDRRGRDTGAEGEAGVRESRAGGVGTGGMPSADSRRRACGVEVAEGFAGEGVAGLRACETAGCAGNALRRTGGRAVAGEGRGQSTIHP